jgi:hypothetical protein
MTQPYAVSITGCVDHSSRIDFRLGNQDFTRSERQTPFTRTVANHNCDRKGYPVYGRGGSNVRGWFWHMRKGRCIPLARRSIFCLPRHEKAAGFPRLRWVNDEGLPKSNLSRGPADYANVNAPCHFRCHNDRDASTTNPEARPARRSGGHQSKPACYGSPLIENRDGPVVEPNWSGAAARPSAPPLGNGRADR